MKNKVLQITILALIFLVFAYFNYPKPPKPHKILEVIDGGSFYIDFNDNNKKDENEFYRMKNVYVFSDISNDFTRKSAKNLNMPIDEYLKNGFIARNWAVDNLENKLVTIKDDKIFFENSDLAELYLKNGLAYTNNPDYLPNQNIYQSKLNANALHKLDFVLLNLKNNIYHKLNCKFAASIYHAKLILKNNSFIPCKVCNKTKNAKIPKPSKLITHKVFSNIEFYLINPYIYKKPNSNCSTEVCKKLVSKINSAKSSIDIAIYGYSDMQAVFNTLKQAKARNVKIRIVIDNNDSYPDNRKLTSEFDSRTDNSKTLMHNKFFIFDNKEVMTGSCNISPSGIGGYNSNVVAFINSKEIANIYKTEFEKMYNGKFSNLKQPSKRIENSNISVYFSPEDNIQHVILDEINKAKSEILVSVFYLTDKKIIDSLIKKKQEGVKVYVLLDATGANNFKNDVYNLRKSKIPTKVENWGGKNHEKTILIDSSVLIFGSSNFSKSGFFKNDENIIRVKNPEIAKFYRDYFFYLFNSIDKKYLYKIPRSEGFESVGSCYDGVDNNFDGKTDSEDVGCM